MPIPQPRKEEDQKQFMRRCMGDSVMKKDFPDIKQRSAVCFSTWRKHKQVKYKLPFEK